GPPVIPTPARLAAVAKARTAARLRILVFIASIPSARNVTLTQTSISSIRESPPAEFERGLKMGLGLAMRMLRSCGSDRYMAYTTGCPADFCRTFDARPHGCYMRPLVAFSERMSHFLQADETQS